MIILKSEQKSRRLGRHSSQINDTPEVDREILDPIAP